MMSFILYQILFEIRLVGIRAGVLAAAVSAWIYRTVGRISGVGGRLCGVVRTRAIGLVLGGCKIHRGLACLLGLESGVLGNAACHETELGVVDEVLEVNAGGEEDVHAGDVLRGERLATVGTDACERNPEVAELVEQNLLALEQLLNKTAAHVGEHALHLSALVAAVLGDVVNKLAEGHHFLDLGPGISLGSLVLLHLVLKQKNRIINHLIAHCRYGTWYLQGDMACPAGVKQ